MSVDLLRPVLVVVGVLHLVLAVANLFLPRLLEWKSDLARLPLLIREVFLVHLLFISITCAIFGAMTLRFAGPMAAGSAPAASWLAGCIALFWTTRTVLQVTYYSRSHWQGRPVRFAIHIGVLLAYGSFATVYALAATQLVRNG